MRASSSDPAPECWEPPVGGAIAEPLVPQLIAMFGLRSCRYESFPFDVLLPRIEPGRIVLPAAEPGALPWSLEFGVELPVHACGLPIGRYVLVPASPSTGVSFPPARRAEAISAATSIGARIAAAIVGETEESAISQLPIGPEARDECSGCGGPAQSASGNAVVSHLRRAARRLRVGARSHRTRAAVSP